MTETLTRTGYSVQSLDGAPDLAALIAAPPGPATSIDFIPPLPSRQSLLSSLSIAGLNISSSSILPGVSARSRWQLGVRYRPLLPAASDDTALGQWAECSTGSDRDKDLSPVSFGNLSVTPYYIWAADVCSTFDATPAERALRARSRLDLLSSFLVARELWSGTLARQESLPNPFLAQSSADAGTPDANTATILNSGSVTDSDDAIAFLEQGYANCARGAVGVIHVTPAVFSLWSSAGFLLLYPDTLPSPLAPLLAYTALGTLVIADAGYTGDGPGGYPGGPTAANAASDDSVWAYITSPVYAATDSIRPLGSSTLAIPDVIVDPDTNDLYSVAERTAVAWWDNQCTFAIRIDAPFVA